LVLRGNLERQEKGKETTEGLEETLFSPGRNPLRVSNKNVDSAEWKRKERLSWQKSTYHISFVHGIVKPKYPKLLLEIFGWLVVLFKEKKMKKSSLTTAGINDCMVDFEYDLFCFTPSHDSSRLIISPSIPAILSLCEFHEIKQDICIL
jgi:hypothetical protein